MGKVLNWVKSKFIRKDIKSEYSGHNTDIFEIQLKKYTETYKLLGEYDKGSIKDPTVLADPGRLQEYISRFQQYSHN